MPPSYYRILSPTTPTCLLNMLPHLAQRHESLRRVDVRDAQVRVPQHLLRQLEEMSRPSDLHNDKHVDYGTQICVLVETTHSHSHSLTH